MLVFQTYITLTITILVALALAVLATAALRAWKFGESGETDSQSKWAWWVEIVTHQPQCTYYFGPFSSPKAAKQSQDDYIQDLIQEGAQGITVEVKWCKPQELTVFDFDQELAELGWA